MQSPSSPFNDALSHRFAQILYQCVETVGSTKGALYLAIKGEDGFRLVSHYGFPRLLPPPTIFAMDHPLVKWIQRERRTFAVNNAAQFDELSALTNKAEMPRILFTPIYDRGVWIGFLVQRDRVRGESYEVGRDEGPTMAICQEAVAAVREFGFIFTTGSSADSASGGEVPTLTPMPRMDVKPAMAVEVPPSSSIVQVAKDFPQTAIRKELARMDGRDDSTGQGTLGDHHADEPTAILSEPSGTHSLRPGMFMPEQRTFFWEAADLLCSIVPLAAVALWMDEPHELRPILIYSRRPLAGELKQQIVAHATQHITRAEEKDLRILTKSEWLEESPARGTFQTYLPVVLMEEGGGQDLLLLFRQEQKPFSEEDQLHIQKVARMLGFHLQEGRLHEKYHRAFLSVAHRILSNVEGGTPTLRTHSLNTAKLARNFAIRLDLPSSEVEAVSISAILHDVGTLLLDPALLAKLDLEPEEMTKIRAHPVLASTFLKDFRFPFDVLRIIRHHHERWDGSGYPDGLRKEEIPIGSRIIGLIEAFEVMSSGNGYKLPKASQDIIDELRREASSQFDPFLVTEFIDFLASKTKRGE